MTMKCTQGQGSFCAIALSLLAACSSGPSTQPSIPPHAVVGVQKSQLTPEFWIARDSNAKKIVLDSQAIAEQNARLLQLDPTVHDLEKFPPALTVASVRPLIEKLSEYPDKEFVRRRGPQARKAATRRIDAQHRARVGAGKSAAPATGSP